MSVFSSFNPALRLNLIVLFSAGLCFWAGLAGLLPALPLFIESLGASGQQIGLVMGSFALGLLLARPTLSRLADQRGRKLVLMIGLVAIAVSPIGYGIVQQLPPLPLGLGRITLDGKLVLMSGIRACHGVSIAAFMTAYNALIADLSPPQNRGELIGYMSLVNPVGMALGPALGGFLMGSLSFEWVFGVMTMLGLIGLGFASQVKETYAPIATPAGSLNANGKAAFWSLLFTPRIRIPAVMLLLVGLAFGTLSTFVPLYVREAGLTLNVGLIYTVSAMSSFVTRFVVGRASDRYGRGRFITLSLACYGVAMGLLWSATSAPMFLLGGLVQGAAAGTLIPMVAALMADRSEAHERGRVFGLCMVGFDVGIALAGPVLGSMADVIGYRGIFGLASVMVFLGLGIFVTTCSKDLAHSLRFALSHGRDVYAVK